MSNDSRYDDILRRIAQNQADTPRRLPLVLDALNAYGFLEELQARRFSQILCYGPRIVASKGLKPHVHANEDETLPPFQENSGLKPTVQTGTPYDEWAGVVVWYKPKGYYGYDTLTLLGIWAVRDREGVTLGIGTKSLAFSGPYYNPESYHRHIQKRFDIYYQDDGSPPLDPWRYSTPYDPTRRLAIRQELQAELARWAAEQR